MMQFGNIVIDCYICSSRHPIVPSLKLHTHAILLIFISYLENISSRCVLYKCECNCQCDVLLRQNYYFVYMLNAGLYLLPICLHMLTFHL